MALVRRRRLLAVFSLVLLLSTLIISWYSFAANEVGVESKAQQRINLSLIPRFSRTVYVFQGGPFDGQHGFVFSIWNRTGEPLSRNELPGSFHKLPFFNNIQPLAVLNSGEVFADGMPVWQGGGDLFEPLFDPGPEVLNPNLNRRERPPTFVAIFPSNVNFLLYRIGFLPTLGFLNNRTRVIVDMTDPELIVEITDPVDGVIVTSSPLTVSGSVNDASASVDVNGVPAILTDNSFSTDVALSPGANEITATAVNANGDIAIDAINILFEPPPLPEVRAVAGFDITTAIGASVTLDGSASTSTAGEPLSYAWTVVSQPAASSATLDDAALVRPTFTIDAEGEYVFALSVTTAGQTITDDVIVSTINSAPVAEAGDDRITAVGSMVLLDGSASWDFDGDALSFQWTLIAAPAASSSAINNADQVSASLMVDEPGDYLVELIVSDGGLNSVEDVLVISTESLPPVAGTSGDVFIVNPAATRLDGRASHNIGGGLLSYQWGLLHTPSGGNALLTDEQRAIPLLDSGGGGDFVAQLTVNDGIQNSIPATQLVSTVNSRPVANSGGDQITVVGNTVTLDGSGSYDANGDRLTLSWALTTLPADSTATLNNVNDLQPSFVADLPGRYIAQLMVNDGRLSSIADTVNISTGALPPFADAGFDQTVFTGIQAVVDGSASLDPNADPLLFSWSFVSAPKGSDAVLSDGSQAMPAFLADQAGAYVLRLDVNDGMQNGASDFVVVSTQNSRPIARAGVDHNIIIGDTVTLDGGASTDPDLDTLTYRWAITFAPADSNGVLTHADSVTANFTPDMIGIYLAQLMVNDGQRDSEVDTVLITVAANDPPSFVSVPPVTIELGNAFTYDADAIDPQSDAIIYSLDQAPTGMSIDSVTGVVDWLPDVAGDVAVTIRATDARGAFAVQSFAVSVTAALNQPPQLDAIGAKAVDLGGVLNINLNASDPNGDPLSFTITPLPLPTGAQLDGSSGLFTYRPAADQSGSVTLTFIVSDGILSDQETVTITVNGPVAGEPTSLVGRVLDTNAFVDEAAEIPIVGATVTVVGSGIAAVSDSNGEFVLAGLNAGEQIFDIDASTAVPGPNGAAYTSFRESLNLIANVTNRIERPFYLSRLAPDSITTVDPTTTTVLDVASLGIQLLIPPSTVKNPDGSDYDGQLSIALVPKGLTPVELPLEFEPDYIISVQPAGLTFAQPAPILLPNVYDLPPGSRMNLWSFDPLRVTGVLQVTDDGTQMVSLQGGIIATTWNAATNPDGDGDNDNENDDNDDDDKCCDQKTGSFTSVANGSLTINHETVSYRSLGIQRNFRFVYDSATASPQPIIRRNTKLTVFRPERQELSALLEVGGVIQAGERFTDASGFTAGQPAQTVLATSFDGSALATGRYDYRFGVVSRLVNFGGNLSAGKITFDNGKTLIHNRKNSHFGVGWGIEGVNRILATDDGALLSRGDGSLQFFTQVNGLGYLGTNLLADAAIDASDAIITDMNNDGIDDIVSVQSLGFEEGGKIRIFISDGEGGFIATTEALVNPGADFELVQGRTDEVAIGDFNNDGIKDVVARNDANGSDFPPFNGYISVHAGIGGGYVETAPADFFPPPPLAPKGGAGNQLGGTPPPGGGDPLVDQINQTLASVQMDRVVRLDLPGDGNTPSAVRVADYDGDGNDDIVARGGGDVFIYYGDGNGAFPNIEIIDPPGFGSRLLSGDINADSRPDLVAQCGDNQACTYVNQGGRNFVLTSQVAISSPGGGGGRPFLIGIGEADDDGQADLIAISRDDDPIYMLGDGLGVFETGVERNGFDTGGDPQTVDANKDGFIDVVSFISGNIQLILNDRQGGFDPAQIIPVNSAQQTFGSALVSGDIDGDGNGDFYTVGNEFVAAALAVTDLSIERFTSPVGDYSMLIRHSDDTFERRLKTGDVEEYRSDGPISAFVDRNGNTTSYTYNAQLQLIQVTDPVGLSTNFTYDGDHLVSLTDPANRVTNFEHDGGGRLIRITDPDGSTRRFSYDDRGLFIQQTSKRGFVTEYEFNFAGRNIASRLPDGTTRAVASTQLAALSSPDNSVDNPAPPVSASGISAGFTNGRGATVNFTTGRFGEAKGRVDSLGRATTVLRNAAGESTFKHSPEGRAVKTVYDSKGNVLQRGQNGIDVTERLAAFQYDENSLPTMISDFAGLVATVNRDPSGNPLVTIDARGKVVTRTFNARGLVETIIDQNGNTTSFAYDATGNPNMITNGEGEMTRLVRDAVGNVVSLVSAFGSPEAQATLFTYDVLSRVTSMTDGENQTMLFRYDSEGNLVETQDATGIVVARQYDELNRLIAINDPATGITTLTRDGDGNITKIIDASGAETQFIYDLANQLISSIDALGAVTSFTYDNDGNLVTVTNASGATTRFEYDGFSRRTKRINPLGQETRFVYDVRDNLVQITDAKGQVLNSVYDELNRLTRLTTPDNIIDLSYDDIGNILTANDIDSILSFSYDAQNRLLTATSGGSASVVAILTNTYNKRGLRTSLADSLGGFQAYAYDNADRLTGLTTALSNTITLSYDAAGRPIGIVFPNDTEMQAAYDSVTGRLDRLAHINGMLDHARFTYNYNVVGNITAIEESGDIGTRSKNFTYDDLQRLILGGTTNAPESYTYDAVGNRQLSHLSTLHLHDAADRLLEDEQFFYEYDENGNLSSKTDKATGLPTFYSWDAQNQLVGIDRPGVAAINYAYDALGRRIEKNIGGVLTRYVYDGEDIFLETDGTSSLQARYTHGERTDQPLAFEWGGSEFYYHADHLGSVRQVTDALGSVVNEYDYDSYGRLLSRFETVSQPYGYTARELDNESDLYYYRARYYNSNIGRFISEDPLGFGGLDVNIYRYAMSSPILLNDPYGLKCFDGPVFEAFSNVVSSAIGGAVSSGVATKSPYGAVVGGLVSGAVTAAEELSGGSGNRVKGALLGFSGGVAEGRVPKGKSNGGGAIAGAIGGFIGGTEGAAVGAVIGTTIENLGPTVLEPGDPNPTPLGQADKALKGLRRGTLGGGLGAVAEIGAGEALNRLNDLCKDDECINK